MTKIYAQGNYIVIESNNERKTFQKKGVGFEIVNYDGLYSLNDKGLPMGDFNYSEVKKEDGSDYATPLEFETFLFENTGNFNSGADVSPNVIENKLDKPTLDGTYLVKKTGSVVSYETFSSVNSSNYYTKSETFSQTEINNLLSNKQDVLTEDNVGQFMDLELSTKLTPSSGDTVLGRDSVTGKAVEIPIKQLGNNSASSETTEDVIATTTVGAINAGEIVQAGTNIQELTELLLNKTFYPTFVNQTFGLTNNAGLIEVGSSFNVTLTFNFNRGQILGKLDNGIWNPTMLQDYRAGIATSYLLNGVSGANSSASFNVTTILGNNTLNGSVTYAEGVQPKDSKNSNYDNPLPSGTSPIQSTSFEGIYPYFYYKSLSPITPAIMQSAIANGQATKVLASSTGTITIPFAANGEYIAVAYPATSTTKTIWYVNALDNGDIPGGLLGAANTLSCNSQTNLWNNVNFKIHVSSGLITQLNPIQLKNS